MADTKITGLTEMTDLQSGDVFPVVDDPGGTPLTQKITAKNLLTGGADIIPAALVYHNADQSIADTTNVTLAFNSETFDNNGIHDPTSNNSRLTCQTAGKYYIILNVSFTTDNAGYRRAWIYLNGTTIIAYRAQEYAASVQTRLNFACVYDLSVSDYLECLVEHNGGAGISITYLADYSPVFGMIRVGD